MASERAHSPDAGAPEGARPTPLAARMRRLWYGLLVLEVVAVLVPSIYNRLTPKLFGFPFFYWYQLAWVLVSMLLTGLVYLLTPDRVTRSPRSQHHGDR